MGLLKNLQGEIERRSLPNGGWPSGSGETPVIETTCYALMALAGDEASSRSKAIAVLLGVQNQDGSWPAFAGDDLVGCWTTALAVITLRFAQSSTTSVQKALRWLLDNNGRESHWFWRWKFRMVDRSVQFNPDKYGWSWFPGTVSWVVPTAFAVVALKQSLECCRTNEANNRIQLGTEMLRDRSCPQGGWNAGNGIAFGAALTPHIDTTAVALLGLADNQDTLTAQALNWLRRACIDCSSAYSLAWSVLALATHEDRGLDECIHKLRKVLLSTDAVSSVETLSLAAIALKVAEGYANPFEVVI